MQSAAHTESGKQGRMSGDTKVQDRTEKRNDLVEKFSESREALQRAMELDRQIVGKTRQPAKDTDGGSTRIIDEQDANAVRLAALLEAARNQEAVPPADGATASMRSTEPPVGRAPAAPVPRPALRQPALIPNPEVTRQPETGAQPAADPVLPPLMGREEAIESITPAKLVFRLALLAAVIGAAIYPYLIAETKDATDAAPSSTAAGPVSVPEPGGATGPLTDAAPVSAEAPSAATIPAPASETVPAGPPPVKDVSASPIHAPPAPASTPAKPALPAIPVGSRASSAAPVAPANVSPPKLRQKSEIPVAPEPAPVPPSRPSTSAKMPTSAGPVPTLKAVSTAPAAAVAAPPAAAGDPVEEAPPVAENASTEMTVPLPPTPPTTEALAPDTPAVAPATPAEAPARPAVVDRRPYFQRLGPTPARNPFRSVPQPEQQPPAARFYFYDVE